MKDWTYFFMLLFCLICNWAYSNEPDSTLNIKNRRNGCIVWPKVVCFVIDDKIVSRETWMTHLNDHLNYETRIVSIERNDTSFQILKSAKPFNYVGKYLGTNQFYGVLDTCIYDFPNQLPVLLYFWPSICTQEGCKPDMEKYRDFVILDSLAVYNSNVQIYVLTDSLPNEFYLSLNSLKCIKFVRTKKQLIDCISSTCLIVDKDGKILDYCRYFHNRKSIEMFFHRMLRVH